AEFNRLLGTRAAMAGRDGDALKLLQRAVTVNPDDFRAWHNLGVLADAGGDSGIAVKLVANSVSINPGYARGWQTLAGVAGRAGRHDLARDSLRRAAALLGTQPTRAAVSPAEK
ncbi:MAG TPA: tetratricopeptide repeat protein, partial [Myxococcota bacterium]|nr:tetratricopeptide repeat protein [Myxococcota bacterium]